MVLTPIAVPAGAAQVDINTGEPAAAAGPGRQAVSAKRRAFRGAITLQDSVDLALRENLAIEVRRSDQRIAEQDIEIRRSEFDPILSAASSLRNRRDPVAASDLEGADRPESENSSVDLALEKRFELGTSVELSTDLYDRSKTNSSFARINPEFNSALRLSVRQPLLKNFGKDANLASLRLAGLAAERADLDFRAEVDNVLLATEEAYWTLAASVAEEEIVRNALELASVLTAEAEERRKVNLATPVDVLEARSAASEKREALLVAQNNTRNAADLLFRTIGILDDTDPVALELQPLPNRTVGSPDPTESFEVALQRAPETLVLDNAIRAREVQLAEARRNRLPALDLTFDAGVLGRGGEWSDTINKVAERDGNFWQTGIEFRIPWGMRLEKAELARARETLERARLERHDAELDLYTRIRSACREIVLSEQRVDAAAVTAELNGLKFEQRRAERETGQSTTRDLLEAQEEMERAELRVVRARVDLLRAVATLAQLEGTIAERHGIDPTRVEGPGAPVAGVTTAPAASARDAK